MIGKNAVKRHKGNPLYQKWYIKGLYAKLFGGLIFALVYTFYYEYGGDTRTYFKDSQILVSSLADGVSVFWDVLFRNKDGVSPNSLSYILDMAFYDRRENFVVNFVSPFVVLGLGSYFSTTLLVAFFTYWGGWHFFLLMARKFPQLEKQMAFSILFVPSVVFWGSGISKDSLIFCSVGLLLYHVNEIMSGKFWQIKSLVIVCASAYFMFVVKAYVIISIAPAIILWRTLYIRDRIKNIYLRALVLPVLSGIAIYGVVFSLNFMAQLNSRYSVNNFVDTAQSMQGWHYVEGHNTAEENGRGSSYTLGDYDEGSVIGMLKVFPAAVNVTFFRPYIWEVKNVAMLAQAFESLLFLLFTIFTVLKVGPIRVYGYIANDSLLLMCVVFAIFFAFAVGFSSYNFGALSRYKIPCIPFFIAALFIIRFKAKEAKIAKHTRYRVNQHVPGFTH